MNNYIIDPSVFYWINALGTMQTVFAIFGILLTICAITGTILYFYNISEAEIDDEPEEEWSRYQRRYMKHAKTCKKWAVTTGIIGIIFVIVSIFLPGKTASVEMLVARTATFENYDWSIAQVKELIDYIVKAIKGIV